MRPTGFHSLVERDRFGFPVKNAGASREMDVDNARSEVKNYWITCRSIGGVVKAEGDRDSCSLCILLGIGKYELIVMRRGNPRKINGRRDSIII